MAKNIKFLYKKHISDTAPDMEKLMTKKTDKAGSVEFTGLEPGEYYIKETRTPKGYIADPGVNSIPVSVQESADEPSVINVKNHYGMVHILKTDQEDGSPLAGAVFGIYDVNSASARGVSRISSVLWTLMLPLIFSFSFV